MPKPIKFRALKPRIRIVNRCIICSDIISPNKIICESCERRQRRGLKLS